MTKSLPISFSTPWQTPWQPEFVGTLNFILQGDEVLLIHKRTGHGAGKINAPGGKLQAGETVQQCAARETLEEVGLIPHQMTCRAELRFVEEDGPQWLGFVFVSQAYGGTPTESVEATPFWQTISAIPYASMWPDDEIWLPLLLVEQQPFLVGNFCFKQGQLLAHEFVSEPSIWQDLMLGNG